ncbi:hypothetical protein [Vibrio vulnificus]|uniref:H-NS family histone-like protein n=1 Tax=Vibrio vulnificus TaxID=672 RepID=UPI0032425EC9
MADYDEALKVVGNLNTLRGMFKSSTSEVIKDVHDKVGVVLAERLQQEEEDAQAEKEREAKRKQALEALAEIGISLDDLLPEEKVAVKRSTDNPVKATRSSPQQYHYLWLDDEDNVCTEYRSPTGKFDVGFTSYMESLGIEFKEDLIFSAADAKEAVASNTMPAVTKSDSKKAAKARVAKMYPKKKKEEVEQERKDQEIQDKLGDKVELGVETKL